MGITSQQRIGPIIFEENVLEVIDISTCLPVGHLLDPPTESIIPIRARRHRRGIARRELLHLRQSIFHIVGVLGKVARGEEGLSGEIPIVIVLILVGRIGGQLVPGVDDTAAGRAIAHRIIGEDLRRGEQGVRGRSQPVQGVIAEGLAASSVGQAGSVSHRVVGIGGLIDLGRTGHNLMENVRDLTSGIIAVGRARAVGKVIAVRRERASYPNVVSPAGLVRLVNRLRTS